MVAAWAGAWWYGRDPSFGAGSSAWFPGGVTGVSLFGIFFTLAGAILGVEIIAQWERRRALRPLFARLRYPTVFVLAAMAAIALMLVPPVALVSLWSVIGAWRAELDVLWLPPAIYVVTCALPLGISAGAMGLFCRLLIRHDLGALFLTGVGLGPLVAFRLLSAPASEVFELSSSLLGILVPTGTLVREALVCYAYALLPIGLAILLLPSPDRRGGGRAGFWSLRPATTLRLIAAIRFQSKQWRILPTAIGLLLATTGGVAAFHAVRMIPPPTVSPDKLLAAAPHGTDRGRIQLVEITNRDIVLPDSPGDEVSIALTVHAPVDPQQVIAVTFGPTLEILSVRADDGAVAGEIASGAFAATSDLRAIRLTDALGAEPRTLHFLLRPTRRGDRLWERAYHPRFRRFAFLGPWYGEAVAADYNAGRIGMAYREAPYRISAPSVEPLAWLCGAARSVKAGDRVELVQPLADSPGKLLAAELEEFPPRGEGDLNVTFALLKGRDALGSQLHAIWSEPLDRIRRLLGQPPQRLVLHEIPEQESGDPLVIPSPVLDRFEILLPDYDDYLSPTKWAFEDAFRNVNRGLIREIVVKSFPTFEEPLLLRDGLIDYLHNYATAQGDPRMRLGLQRKEVSLIPWEFVARSTRPFDIEGSTEEGWKGALSPSLRAAGAREANPMRAVAFHHMLRGVVGEDAFAAGLLEVISHSGGPMTLDLYREAMEKASGKELADFFEEWLVEGVVPRYRIRKAQAFLIQDPISRAVEYRTELTIANEGSGTMPVPWMLSTEGEPLRGKEILGPGSEATISLTTIDRPVVFEIDPAGWISHVPPTEAKGKESTPARALFRTITQL